MNAKRDGGRVINELTARDVGLWLLSCLIGLFIVLLLAAFVGLCVGVVLRVARWTMGD